jgi:ribosomal protein L37AE/L43A
VSTLQVTAEPGDYQCPTCGAQQPKRLIGGAFHCLLCAEECTIRPAVLAAIEHEKRAAAILKDALRGVRGAPPAHYGCHNRPDKSPTYLAQDGYCEPFQDPSGVWFKGTKYVEVPHVMSEDCRYDKRATDSKCAGCRHKEPKP